MRDYTLTHSGPIAFASCYVDGAYRYTRRISLACARRLLAKVGRSRFAWALES